MSPTNSAPHSRGSPANSRGDVPDALKSFKITLEDPTWRVLPAVLKKYKIKDEDWRKYALFIAYSNSGTLFHLLNKVALMDRSRTLLGI
jgi:hypothetical protein